MANNSARDFHVKLSLVQSVIDKLPPEAVIDFIAVGRWYKMVVLTWESFEKTFDRATYHREQRHEVLTVTRDGVEFKAERYLPDRESEPCEIDLPVPSEAVAR